MYSAKEKIQLHRKLLSIEAAEADLVLLQEKAPGNSNLVKYRLSPRKNAEDILFDLLGVCDYDEIVRNRRTALKKQKPDVPKHSDNQKKKAAATNKTKPTKKTPATKKEKIPAPKKEKAPVSDAPATSDAPVEDTPSASDVPTDETDQTNAVQQAADAPADSEDAQKKSE